MLLLLDLNNNKLRYMMSCNCRQNKLPAATALIIIIIIRFQQHVLEVEAKISSVDRSTHDMRLRKIPTHY